MIDYRTASDLVQKNILSPRIEDVSIDAALGRVLTQDVIADRDYPPFHRSSMDGYAVNFAEIPESRPFQLLEQSVQYAGKAAGELNPHSCIKIMTGAPVPSGADTVIKIEDSQKTDDLVSFNPGKFFSGMNIALQGEDTRAGELLLPRGTIIGPIETGCLATCGLTSVKVAKPPAVSIIITGDELAMPGDAIESYNIRSSNYFVLLSFSRKTGIEPVMLFSKDTADELEKTIRSAIGSDIIILTGGVSKGDRDFVPEILEKLGFENIFHGVNIKPGKPFWFGRSRTTVVFGLPGNPFAVMTAWKLFVENFLLGSMGAKSANPIFLPIAQARTKKDKRNEFFPCRIETRDGISILREVRINGSGDIRAGLLTDGIGLHPAGAEILSSESRIEFHLW